MRLFWRAIMKFEELNLAPAILQAVQEQGYDTPTPVQAQAIPIVLAGHDLLAGAQTGTGKTAAFMLPILHKLSLSEAGRNKFGGKAIRALVLTPTRELAAQIEESAKDYGKYLSLQSTVVFGGVGMRTGRRDQHVLRVGDALDFWRIADVKEGETLLLCAEMRLPGQAWLEFRLSTKDGGTHVVQRAIFRPRGLAGRLYWWVLIPFHAIIFPGMLRNALAQAEKS